LKFEDFGKIGKPQATGPGVPVEGTFGCQYCDDVCSEATFHPDQKIIVWVCANKHVSNMEWKV
jgi:hypothetical protein